MWFRVISRQAQVTNMIGCGKVYKPNTTKGYYCKLVEQLSFNCSSNIMVLLLEDSILKGNISDRWNPIFVVMINAYFLVATIIYYSNIVRYDRIPFYSKQYYMYICMTIEMFQGWSTIIFIIASISSNCYYYKLRGCKLV